ncbi:hypothetical protein [Saccharibacillus sacchari]|uniref:Uncharacterized protein n=1 Tax=Saccharibacillus sacchari TaxID=456493 RepID=A0ACC6PHE8_9BACL
MESKKTRLKVSLVGLSLVLLIAVLTECVNRNQRASFGEHAVPRELTIAKNTTNQNRDECKGTLDYLDGLMLNNIHYSNKESLDERGKSLPAGLIGDRISEVSYTMSGDACSDFVMRSGDATLLPTGTPIYEMKGYKPDFRVIADGRIFEVSDNPDAKTIGDLYDIEGKVAKVSRVSGNDGSLMREFSPEDTQAFLSDLLSLEYVGFEAIYTNNPPEYRISLQLDLNDGTNIRLGYWPKANAIVEGAYGTERMLAIVQGER